MWLGVVDKYIPNKLVVCLSLEAPGVGANTTVATVDVGDGRGRQLLKKS